MVKKTRMATAGAAHPRRSLRRCPVPNLDSAVAGEPREEHEKGFRSLVRFLVNARHGHKHPPAEGDDANRHINNIELVFCYRLKNGQNGRVRERAIIRWHSILATELQPTISSVSLRRQPLKVKDAVE